MGPFGLIKLSHWRQVAERIPVPSVRHTVMGRGGLKVVLAIARNSYGVLKHLFHKRLLHSVSSKLYISFHRSYLEHAQLIMDLYFLPPI